MALYAGEHLVAAHSLKMRQGRLDQSLPYADPARVWIGKDPAYEPDLAPVGQRKRLEDDTTYEATLAEGDEHRLAPREKEPGQHWEGTMGDAPHRRLFVGVHRANLDARHGRFVGHVTLLLLRWG